MTTELFIENYPADLTAELSALLTFSIDDVKDFAARSTAWSKTVVLPGTARNNKIFGHIFQVGNRTNTTALPRTLTTTSMLQKAHPALCFRITYRRLKEW